MDTRVEERLVNLLDARNSFRRHQRSKHKAKNRRRENRKFVPSPYEILNLPGLYTSEWVNLKVPEILCLDTNYDETVGLLQEIRRVALQQRRPLRLIFDGTKVIKPSALLILLAELYRCRMIHGERKITGTYPDDAKLERMMCASGFFEVLGVKGRIKAKRTYPMEYIKFVTDVKLQERGALRLREELLGEEIEMEIRARKRLQRAITEAMLNAKQHAYPATARRAHPGKNRWWLSGHYNRKTKYLTIMFCDLGVGIPATVNKLYLMEQIRAAISALPGIQVSDGKMIQAAMELGRTRTGKDGRGKGLNDLRKFIDHARVGELKIFSKKGVYSYLAGGKEETADYQRSIGGTLIRWSVPIENVTDWAGEDYDYDEETDH